VNACSKCGDRGRVLQSCPYCAMTYCRYCEHDECECKLLDFDALAEAGHLLTIVSGPIAGVWTYYCDRCGALMQTQQDWRILFHVPAGSKSTASACSDRAAPRPPVTLEDKLRALSKRSLARLNEL